MLLLVVFSIVLSARETFCKGKFINKTYIHWYLVILDDANKLRKERPPLPRVSSAIRKSTNGLNTSGTVTPVTQPATPQRAPVPERRLSTNRKVCSESNCDCEQFV